MAIPSPVRSPGFVTVSITVSFERWVVPVVAEAADRIISPTLMIAAFAGRVSTCWYQFFSQSSVLCVNVTERTFSFCGAPIASKSMHAESSCGLRVGARRRMVDVVSGGSSSNSVTVLMACPHLASGWAHRFLILAGWRCWAPEIMLGLAASAVDVLVETIIGFAGGFSCR